MPCDAPFLYDTKNPLPQTNSPQRGSPQYAHYRHLSLEFPARGDSVRPGTNHERAIVPSELPKLKVALVKTHRG
jgi:hypothetical protein